MALSANNIEFHRGAEQRGLISFLEMFFLKVLTFFLGVQILSTVLDNFQPSGTNNDLVWSGLVQSPPDGSTPGSLTDL